MSKEIKFIHHERTTTITVIPDTFWYRRSARHFWLQKLCMETLERLGCVERAVNKTVELKQTIINPDKLMDAVFAQVQNVEELFERRPKSLIIGSGDYAELMQEQSPDEPLSFAAKYMCGTPPTVIGLRVYLVPWLKGIVAI